MPHEFLNDQHLLEYGAYVGTPSTEQLHKYFYLEDSDLELISYLRYDYTRLGVAVQIGTLRYLGTFLERPTAVPEAVKTFVASQLKLRRGVDLAQYGKAKDVKYEHRALIRAHLGYKEFKGLEVLHLNRFLYSKALVADERPIVLFDSATLGLPLFCGLELGFPQLSGLDATRVAPSQIIGSARSSRVCYRQVTLAHCPLRRFNT